MKIDIKNPIKFMSQIEGIPCTVVVTWYKPAVLAIAMDGPFENSEPMESSEFEFYIEGEHRLESEDLDGRITKADEDRLFAEFEAYLLAQKHFKEF